MLASACLVAAAFAPIRIDTPEKSTVNPVALLTIGVAASQAVAQSLVLSHPTDTVRLTHEVPSSSDLTMEARIWIPVGASSLGSLRHAVWREQRNSLEDKGFAVCSQGIGFGGSGGIPTVEWIGPVPTEEWIHVACQAEGGIGRIWLNGVLVAQAGTSTGAVVAGAAGSSNSIGAGLHNGSQFVPGAICRLDWLRISTCVRYSVETFEPPACGAMLPDACTALLFNFDEPAGSPVLLNEGYLTGVAQVGAPWVPGATSPRLGEPVASCCPGDVDLSDGVNGIDLAIVLQNWGIPSPKYPRSDVDGDGLVNGSDLALVLSNWGACP